MREKNQLIDKTGLRDTLSKLSKEINISKWDLGASIGKDISVQIQKGSPKQVKASQKSSITIRVWNSNNAVGITSTTDLSELGLKKALNSALLASNYGNIRESPEFSITSKNKLPVLDRPIRQQIGVKRLLDSLIRAENDLLNKHKAIEGVPYNGFGETQYERVYINSDGALRHMESTQASLYLYARAQEEGKKPRSSGSIRVDYGATDIDIDNCVEEAANKTLDHLNYHPIKTGKYLICFKPEAFLDLISSFSNIYNARSILDGLSLSNKDSLGEKISSDILSLNDNGLHVANYGSCSFDGEGTPTQDISIIDSGILVNFIHSEATARLLNSLPTGHAGLGAKVSVSPDWPVINKSKKSIAKYPHLNHKLTTNEFILVENLNALHAGIKPSQGSFSLPFDGWHVRNGEKVSIESATIAGDFRALLKNIVQIEGQQINTHQGVSPHVWIEELAITGDL
ncbi:MULTISPECIES: TldD/PmbA family protein [unclassified Prochlorococcus]|uniref:TldD/PmbA family protein n=1 Tax=unclassified Prochlorococcus TaxID=2627481 RepID=UPI0005337567|nr:MULTISPECIES: TldD/PmbA family protein [unclassified Prochlorococcus]KGG15315.1 TldE/PmbA protein [Prochlorococcus sp. MIT 0602]KGG17594.1 TldE/PmbA protein [Prochlorococcus sp. MIT 0603]